MPETSPRPTRLAEVLRTQSLIIVCNHAGWALKPDPHRTSGRSHDVMIA
jgi:hypothetical protein